MTLPGPLSRRDVVRGGVVLAALGLAPALSSCAAEDTGRPGPENQDGAGRAAGAPSGQSDVDLLTAAIQDESRLLALAAATLRRHRPLARQVRPVVTRQRAHVKVLSDSLTERPTIRRGRPPKVPTAAPAALAQLRNQVAGAEEARAADCLVAASGLLARLLASTSSSHATTVETLPGRLMSVAALQNCLAAEHAAVYGYGVLGGVLSGVTALGSADQERAASGYVEHRTRRDNLTAAITAAGAEPVAADPAYETPRRVETVDDCRALARDLEDRCAQVYADAVAQSVDDDRETAAHALTACALRAVTWGARPQPFPGVAEV